MGGAAYIPAFPIPRTTNNTPAPAGSPVALHWYMIEPQSAQNIMPENIPISPILVGLRRVCRASLTASAMDSVQIGSWVFSKITHSLSGF